MDSFSFDCVMDATTLSFAQPRNHPVWQRRRHIGGFSLKFAKKLFTAWISHACGALTLTALGARAGRNGEGPPGIDPAAGKWRQSRNDGLESALTEL